MKVGGRLEGSIALGGTPATPVVDGRLNGADLSLSTRQQGLNLRDGQMLLDLKDDRVFIRHLKFKSPHQPPPASLAGLAPRRIAELVRLPGTLEVTGESRVGDQNANVELRMDRVGVLQRNDQWVVLSGNGRLNLQKRTLAISGSLRADAAWWELPKRSSISLSDDVVFKQLNTGGTTVRQPPLHSRLDLDIQAGDLAYFRGAGLESRLTGSLKLSSDLGRGLRANGIIQAVSGRYDAYGQRLEIERGLINFSGLIDNPGLNIRAMRRRLPVEAGVEVTGTAQRPRFRLVSEPNVADVEKLSWLVQGRAPDQGGSKDSEMLIAAATSILGDGGGVVTELQRKLGIDEFGINSGTLDSGQGKAGTSRVATTGGSDTGENAGTQIVTVGKRLSDNTVLTYEQSIATAESIVKLTVNLSNRLSLVARSGTENALDLFYSFRFGNTSRQR
jgi:translocation and assembly module TamB